MADHSEDVSDEFPSIGDKKYQEKTVQALFEDHLYAEQVHDIIKPEFFKQRHLSEIVRALFEYREKYATFPSTEVIEDILKREQLKDVVRSQCASFLENVRTQPLNGDARYIQETSIDFCRRQSLMEGITKALNEIEINNFDSVWKIITDAANKGATRDLGHDYLSGFDSRTVNNVRHPIPTPWPVLNSAFGGGWDRGSLSTFIGPTGAGKTHFLVNVSAGTLARGYNVVYVSMEIADFKIGLRHDAYFSGVRINDITDEAERVKQEIETSVPKGKLWIKEFPVKSASVSTIRSYLQRLQVTQGGFRPDILVVDYAALLRAPRIGDKSYHDLESVYNELRGLAQEWNMVVITADQTNRVGLNQEIVTLDVIADAYNRATVCDGIITISRTVDDKAAGTGRVFVAKSRFGSDGMVYPFSLDPAKVKVDIKSQMETVAQVYKEGEEASKKRLVERFNQLMKKGEDK
jgi:replicative DNA helicase